MPAACGNIDYWYNQHFNIASINQSTDNLLAILSENGGKFPDFKPNGTKSSTIPAAPSRNSSDNSDSSSSSEQASKQMMSLKRNMTEETKYQTRYFVVFFDSKNKISRIDTGHVAAITSTAAETYGKRALASGKTDGTDGNYTYRKAVSGSETMYIFVDCREQNSTKSQFLAISSIIAFAGYVIVVVLVMIFSKHAIKPVIESFEKQKQFITDAGHEIKTPLAIISANTEVLEMTGEPNEWTESIKNQINRLDGLLKNLLHLAKMDEDNVKLTYNDFNISDAVIDAATPFETLAQTRNKTVKLNIADGLMFHGDEGAIRQLVSIFTENAVKYCDEGGEIKVNLYSGQGGKGVVFSVSNPCSTPPECDLSKLFDRFYRADESHSRNEKQKKGGYGIGLSIAKAITESHKGKISCSVDNGEITFKATFSKSIHKALDKQQ